MSIHTGSLMSAALSAALAGDDNARNALIAVSDRWFHWLMGCTVAVAVGCFLEMGESTVEGLHWWWRRKDKPFQEDDARWSVPWSIVGLFLVILGVAGEGFFEAKQSTAETAVRQYDEKLLADTILKAGTAKDSADLAANAAVRAKDAADSASQKAVHAQSMASNVEKTAESIDNSLGFAQYMLADRELLNAEKLKVDLAPILKGKTVIFRSYVNDGDAYFLCFTLTQMAASIGAQPVDECGFFRVEPPYPMLGINVFGPDTNESLALIKVLGSATMFGATGPVNGVPSQARVIFIGRKPAAKVGSSIPKRTMIAKKP